MEPYEMGELADRIEDGERTSTAAMRESSPLRSAATISAPREARRNALGKGVLGVSRMEGFPSQVESGQRNDGNIFPGREALVPTRVCLNVAGNSVCHEWNAT